MLEHLDDPDPPRPSELVVDRIAAEGGRRLRRRRVAAGGVAVLLATLGIAGVVSAAGQLDRHDDGQIDMVDDDGDTPSPTPAPTTTAPPSTTTSTSPVTSTPTDSAVPPVGGDPATDEPFVAVVKDPDADAAQVVLADATSGEVTEVLAEFALTSRPPLCCITWSPASGDIWYVVPAGQGDGAADDTIWHVSTGGGQPASVTTGTSPSVSPDGARLAFVRTTADGPAIVIHDLASGDELVYPQAVDLFVRDTAWADDETVIVTQQIPESALLAVAFEAATGQTEYLGPPDGAPSGTSWLWVDLRPDGRLDVVERCCTLDAGTIDGATYHLVVDAATGEELERTELPISAIGIFTEPAGDEQLVVVPPPGAPGYGTLRRLAGMEAVEVPGGLEVIAADW